MSSVEQKGFEDLSEIISRLQEAREYAKKENDPLVTRAIRMVYEHLENEEGWAMPVIGNDEEEEDAEENAEEAQEEPQEEVEYSAEEHFTYVLNLLLRSENTYNRDELRKIANQLNDF